MPSHESQVLSTIRSKIYIIEDKQVMFDFDLAALYEVENRALKQAVRRNISRFPEDFMFQLSRSDWQEVITNCDNLPDNVKYAPVPPYVFTEQGVAMLSSVLKSDTAIRMNIAIMRAFVKFREHYADFSNLKQQIEELEVEMQTKFTDIDQALKYLLQKDLRLADQSQRRKIGFVIVKDGK